MLINVARNLIRRDPPVSTLLCSMEQSRLNIAQRVACIDAGVNLHELRGGRMNKDAAQAYGKALTSLQTLPLFFCDRALQTVATITANAMELKKKHKLSVLMVDYLQLVRGPRRLNREQEVAAISRGLRLIANDLDVTVVACAQLNRGSEDRQDHRPRLADLRASGAIEADADAVVLLHRPEMHEPGQFDGIMEVLVAKQRNGPTGEMTLLFEKPTLRFKDYDAIEHSFSM